MSIPSGSFLYHYSISKPNPPSNSDPPSGPPPSTAPPIQPGLFFLMAVGGSRERDIDDQGWVEAGECAHLFTFRGRDRGHLASDLFVSYTLKKNVRFQ